MPNYAITIARRIIQQVIRDRRTLALILVAPVVIMALIGYSVPDKTLLNAAAPALITMVGFFMSFLLTGISFLRERSQGTMERLMASPVSRLDIVLGYLLGFLVFAIIQSLIVFFFTIYVFNVPYHGAVWEIMVFQLVAVIGAVTLGILISTFANNEFQVVQFIPLIILPQVFLCGILWPVSQMSGFLQGVSDFLPVTYAVKGLREIMLNGSTLANVGGDIAALLGFAGITSLLAARSIKRGT